MGTDAFVSCGKTCEHAVAFDGMFASRSPGRAETCEQTLRARRLKTPGARRSVCKSSLSRLSRNNPFSQARRGLKRIVPIIPPAWGAAILAARGRRWNGPIAHCAVRTHGTTLGRDGVPSPSARTAAYCNPAEQRTRKPKLTSQGPVPSGYFLPHRKQAGGIFEPHEGEL